MTMSLPRMSARLAGLTPLCALLIACIGGCESDMERDAARTRAIDALFAPLHEGRQPGAAVLVMQDGDVVFGDAYGYAELDAARPITIDSPFRLASVSKQFTAMAVMLLAEEGRLDYDDPLTRWLPDLDAYPGVTIRHLLQHTSGLPDYYDSVADDAGRLSNADVQELLAERAEPAFAPGERYEYSNSGYEMLANIVAAASGRDFASFMRERVFDPIGMHDTLVHDHSWPDVDDRVYGYERRGDTWVMNDDSPLNGIIGSGSMFAPLTDFVHWDRALRERRLVSAETLEEAFAAGRLNDGQSIDYGFGWAVEEYRGRRLIRHGGSWVGFRTQFAYYPDDGLTIVILSNRADFAPESYVEPISDIYFDP